jgi:hypothetical protein
MGRKISGFATLAFSAYRFFSSGIQIGSALQCEYSDILLFTIIFNSLGYQSI